MRSDGRISNLEYSNKPLSDIVFTKIYNEIIEGVLKRGDKLPSENQLCELHNVSRVSVRSAIQKLQAQGFVYTQPGKGTYVLSDNIGATMMRNMARTMDMSEQEYIEIIELRQTIEYKSLELMAKRGTKDDFREMEEALEDMKHSRDDYRKFANADLRFHMAIIKGSHNRLFYDLMNSCRGALEKYFNEMNKVNIDEFEDPLYTHQVVINALKGGDVKLAQNTMLGIIETNIKNNMGYLKK